MLLEELCGELQGKDVMCIRCVSDKIARASIETSRASISFGRKKTPLNGLKGAIIITDAMNAILTLTFPFSSVSY